MLKVEFKYKFTGRFGSNLYESLRETDFNAYREGEARHILEVSKIGGGIRDDFVSWLESELSFYKWEKYAQKAGVSCDTLSAWLINHEVPNEDELKLREKYSIALAEDTVSDFSMFCMNDVETAYTFGFLKHNHLPQDVQHKIEFLRARARKYDGKDGEIANKLRNFSGRLEKEACEKLILVSGFYCNIHDSDARYEKPIPRTEVLTCPTCGHPVCPVCANMSDKDPADIGEAREYVASCESVSGHAFCGHCGDYSVEFMLRFLKLIGCPIPPECEDFKPIPREVEVITTRRVADLPNKDDITAKVLDKFNNGASGIICTTDPSGEIWGVPERHPDGWKLTICYPEER